MIQTILGIILLLAAVFLVVAVLMQHGKSHNLSGAIAGGAETFFGKSKGATIDKTLNTLTTVVAIVFVLIVIVMYVIQPAPTESVAPENTEVSDTVSDDVSDSNDANVTDTEASDASVVDSDTQVSVADTDVVSDVADAPVVSETSAE